MDENGAENLMNTKSGGWKDSGVKRWINKKKGNVVGKVSGWV